MQSMMLSMTETNKEQQSLYSLLYKHGESCSFYSLNKGTQQPTGKANRNGVIETIVLKENRLRRYLGNIYSHHASKTPL